MTMHEGHRQRMRERFRREGLEGFAPHEVLELLLFYGRARGDVNPLAHELLDIRLNVEPWVASLAAQQATEEDVADLRRLCEEIEGLIHAGQNHLLRDEALHVRIARCTQNRVVSKLLPVITYSVQLFGKLTDQRIYQETIETHRRIVDAIANHDPDGARDAMPEHLMGNFSAISEQEELQAEGKSSEKLEQLEK